MAHASAARDIVGDSIDTIERRIAALALQDPGRLALLSPTGARATFGELRATVDQVRQVLRGSGVGPTDRVALILPSGIDLATAFLGVAASAASAPINPGYTEAELVFSLRDLGARAVVVGEGSPPIASHVATRLGLGLFVLTRATAGLSLDGGAKTADAACGVPVADDIALLLHTSGTTSRPKLVPLSHHNLLASAGNIAECYGLGIDDCCLNVMPLFHIHGLVGGLLAPALAGGRVACVDRFVATQFFDWIERLAPTWCTAVPTIYQAILAEAERSNLSRPHRLRFLRSSSAALAPSVKLALEGRFGVPVVEAYSMTEAAHQMASTPLPPGDRRPGTVGRATGTEIAIMSEENALLAPGMPGEIVVRGAGITRGYENNPDANQHSFIDGWFRTGDVGVLDAEGILRVTGRLKEVINKGGEKIAPLEVEAVLMEHPDVGEAVVFALAHPTLGEEVAAAVVPRGPGLSETALRAFLATRLARHKHPRVIHLVDQIPKGPTGKVRRQEMAAVRWAKVTPGMLATAGFTSTESAVADIWCSVLGLKHCGPDDDFFLLGGDSLQATTLVGAVAEAFGVELPVDSLFDTAATVAKMARAIVARGPGSRRGAPLIAQEAPPASFGQQSFWMFSRLFRGDPSFNGVAVLRAIGSFDRDALARAVRSLLIRHEPLRTRLRRRGRSLIQDVARPERLDDPIVDLDAVSLESAIEQVRLFVQRPFDLETDCPTRVALVRVHAGDYLLALVVHHSAADGWGREIAVRDLIALYRAEVEGRPPQLPTLRRTFADWAREQREAAAQGAFTNAIAEIRGEAAISAALALPIARPRPEIPDWRGDAYHFTLSSTVAHHLRSVARRQRATLFVTLLAGAEALFHSMTGERRFLLGVPMANRGVETLSLVGSLVNIVPFAVDIDPTTAFSDFVAAVRARMAVAHARQVVPTELVAKALPAVARPAIAAVLLPVQVQLRSFARPIDEIADGAVLRSQAMDSWITPLDLSVEWDEVAGGLECRLRYRANLFEAAAVSAMAERYAGIMRTVADAPDTRIGRL